MRFCQTTINPLAALVFCACAFCAPVRGADETAPSAEIDPAAKEELAYVQALVESGLPDLATSVIAAAKEKWPTLKPKLKVLEVQGDLVMGKFADVQKVIDAMPQKNGEYWAMRLAMADAYYARSEMAECRKTYQEFFAAVPKPGADIMEFYIDSGFRWAQMCTLDKKYDDALKMYANLLAKIPKKAEEDVWCAVAQAYIELLVRQADAIPNVKDPKRLDYLNKAEKIVDELLWKSHLALVFGKAISMKAHIVMLRGNLEKAQGIVNNYMPTLSDIHKSLMQQDPKGLLGYVRQSPMPECRYLLANILWKTAQQEAAKAKPNEDLIKDSIFGAKTRTGRRNNLGAYNHAINVFVNYPESAWAASAGDMTEAIEKFVKARYKKDIKTNVTAGQRKKVRDTQFQNAWDVWKSNDMKETVKAYTQLLASFPEYKESVGALGILAQAYLNLWKDEKDNGKKLELRLNAEAIEGQIAERFSEWRDEQVRRTAGDETLRLAATEHDNGSLARAEQLYDLYFKNYPTHYNAAQMATSLAYQAFQKEDWEKAIHYYTIVAETYTNSTYYASALQQLATCNGKLGNGLEQEAWLRRFAQAATKMTEKAAARLLLANLQQKRGFKAFADVANAVGGTNSVEQLDAMRMDAYRGVAGAIRDFRGTANMLTEAIEKNPTLGAGEKEKFIEQRSLAQYLEGESWQRLQYPTNKIAAFRQQAVKAYENYLAMNPKGKWAPVVLVKLATIHTADKRVEEAQKAFERLQKDFPQSEEAKSSVPRLAKTLIEMGLKQEGVDQYRQMLANASGKYSAFQFLDAGNALLDAHGWDVANEAFSKAITLSESLTNKASQAWVTSNALLGQARASMGQKSWAEAHGKLDDFIRNNGKNAAVTNAYDMIVTVALQEGAREQDNDRRRRLFNDAVNAVKKLRGFSKDQAELDRLSLRSGDILKTKMEAEEQMNLPEQAKETCGRAVSTFIVFLQAHAPTDPGLPSRASTDSQSQGEQHLFKDMTPAQQANLERCYGTLLPLMVKLGKEQSEQVLVYGKDYLYLFSEGKHKAAVQDAMTAAAADK